MIVVGISSVLCFSDVGLWFVCCLCMCLVWILIGCFVSGGADWCYFLFLGSGIVLWRLFWAFALIAIVLVRFDCVCVFRWNGV